MLSDELNALVHEAKKKLGLLSHDDQYEDDLITLFDGSIRNFILHAIRTENLNRLNWAFNGEHRIITPDVNEFLDYVVEHYHLSIIVMLKEKLVEHGFGRLVKQYFPWE